jgi:pimeloyl-ACP methyl ester carboxylesterase
VTHDGADDMRPRWAVDSLEHALPNVTRAILSGAGHVPWLEAPAEFTGLVLDFLDDQGAGGEQTRRSISCLIASN